MPNCPARFEMKLVASKIKKMKTKLTLTIAMLSIMASAQTLKITRTNGAITLSITDTNHLYAIQYTTNLPAGFTQAGTSVIGGPGYTATYPVAGGREFYRARQLDGFLIYATPIASVGGGAGACTGPYIGYAVYSKPGPDTGWIMATNAASYIASDPGRSDTHIYAASISGDYACGQTPITIPYAADPDGQFPFIFVVYFNTLLSGY